MFLEVRQYQTQPGRREEWVTYMDGTVIPFMSAQGMDVKGSYLDEENPDGYVWIRAFDSEEQRVKLYADVYESRVWKDEIGPVVYSLLDLEKSVITRITPTTLTT